MQMLHILLGSDSVQASLYKEVMDQNMHRILKNE